MDEPDREEFEESYDLPAQLNLSYWHFLIINNMSKSKNSPLGKAIIKSIQKKNQYTPHDDMAIFFQKSETNE